MGNASSAGSLRGRDLVGLGGLLAGAVVAGTGIGLLVDHSRDSAPTFTLVGIFAGVVLGAVGFALRVRAALRADAR